MTNTVPVLIEELEGAALRYAVSRIAGYEGRRPLDAFATFHEWQSYESSWGVPMPDYESDWKKGGQLIEKYAVSVEPYKGFLSKWMAVVHEMCAASKQCSLHAYGDKPLIAVCRAIVAAHTEGPTVQVPASLVGGE